MTSKYLFWASSLIVSVLVFSSCLKSSENRDVELSPDAQIYTFSLSSKADANRLLSTPFTIDQINGKVFNKSTLPYQFHVDSVLMTVAGNTSNYYGGLSQVVVKLSNPDENYIIGHKDNKSDSIALSRIHQIVTTAANGKSTKTYTFQLNIYQQDPNILTWELKKQDYLTPPVSDQKTIAFKERFITYYKSGSVVKAMSTPTADGVNWAVGNVTGLPPAIQLSSVIAVANAAYAMDADNTVYTTSDGLSWGAVASPYPVAAIYGKLPSATGGDILTIVNHNGVLKFAETNNFTEIKLMDEVPAAILNDIPVKNFSATKIDNPTVHAAKYIVLSGGVTKEGNPNNKVWLFQEKEGVITALSETTSTPLAGSSVYFYDNKLYLMTAASGKNVLKYSENYGLNWKEAGEAQALPSNFAYRSNASVITGADNYIWIFGGISAGQTQLADVWRGRLNKLAGN